MRVLLHIGSMATGGAQRQAMCTASGLGARGLDVCLVTVFPGGGYWHEALADSDFELLSLYGYRPRNRFVRLLALLFAPVRLRSIINRRRIDVVYSMLDISNIVARLATIRKLSTTALVWGIRSADRIDDYRAQIPYQLCKRMVSNVHLVISNSHAGLATLRDDGFNLGKAEVIHNGIDMQRFQFTHAGRNRLREKWQIGDDETAVGMVGRTDPRKGHERFIKMSAYCAGLEPKFRFLCVGAASEREREKLLTKAATLGLGEQLTVLCSQQNMAAVYSALDIVVSSSDSEGFPNVIAEAMACGRTCVVTDVGDSRLLVGDCGFVADSLDVTALGDSVLAARRVGSAYEQGARDRVMTKFSLPAMIDSTYAALAESFHHLHNHK